MPDAGLVALALIWLGITVVVTVVFACVAYGHGRDEQWDIDRDEIERLRREVVRARRHVRVVR